MISNLFLLPPSEFPSYFIKKEIPPKMINIFLNLPHTHYEKLNRVTTFPGAQSRLNLNLTFIISTGDKSDCAPDQ